MGLNLKTFAFIAVVTLMSIGAAGAGFVSGMKYAMDTESDRAFVASCEKPSTLDVLWGQYYNAEFNVRYRDFAGDDGLRPEWIALRDKYKVLYDADGAPDKKQLDELFIERCRIEHREQDPDMGAVAKADEQLRAEVKESEWPK